MKWQKTPDELALFLKASLQGTKCQSRKMFGCPSYFINSNMFVGAFQKDIFIRLSPKDIEETLRKYPDLKHFEPRPGIVMKEYVSLPESIYKQKNAFSRLLRKSVSYVRSLPTRKKRRKH
jgi:TfoX/Sxy family transcriptional regulator of competence genes